MNDYDVEFETLESGYMVTCYHCEEQFFAKRYGATFCSSKCRTSHHRKIKQLEKDIEAMHILIDKLIDQCRKQGMGKIATNLENAKNRIEYLLDRIESSDEEVNSDKFSHDNIRIKFRAFKA